GFGTNANCFEGSGPTPNLSNTTAAIRDDGGCVDTDDNSADFSVASPAPRNTASPVHVCEGGGDPDPDPDPEPVDVVVISLVSRGRGHSRGRSRAGVSARYSGPASAFALDGWTVQYGSACGTSWSARPPTRTMGTGGYLTIGQAVGGGGTV